MVLVCLDERFVAAQKIAEQREDERPQARADAGVKREGAGVRAGESGGDGNQVADAGYEATGEVETAPFFEKKASVFCSSSGRTKK